MDNLMVKNVDIMGDTVMAAQDSEGNILGCFYLGAGVPAITSI